MVNRYSVLLVVAALLGFAAAGRPATAQVGFVNPVPPFLNGSDDVTLHFERGAYSEGVHYLRCTVAEIQGIWIRCAPDAFATQREQKWHSLERVIQITKREK